MSRAHRVCAPRAAASVALAAVASVAVAAVVIFTPAVARAQQPGQPPALPMAIDLKKVDVGSWADYTMSVGALPPMKSRMALVAKSAGSNTLEMVMEGGMLAMSGSKLVMHTEVDSNQGAEHPVKRVLMQVGENDPMEMPIESQQQTQFRKPNPKTFVKEETVKVAAGTYKTRHYHDKTPNGDAFDFWVSNDVPPYGIVKVEADQTHAPGPAKGLVRFELTATGKDAKMLVTRPAKPYDQGKMVGQLLGGAGNMRPLTPPAGAPPPTKP